jgi:predicted porin
MIKKLIPAAVLLSLFGAAQAEVSIYGLVDVSYGKSLTDAATDGKSASFHSGGDGDQGNSATKVGLKGSTEVSKGLKANFQLETNGIKTNLTMDTPYFNRAAWAGLSGSFGEVRLGRQDSVAFQTMIGFDSNGAANMASAQGNAGVPTWGPGRQTSYLQYIAPEMAGFKAQVGFAAKDAEGKDSDKANYAFGLTYTAGPLSAAVTTETARFEAKSSFTSVAASYDFKVAKVMVGYADGGLNAKGSTVGVVAPVAGFNVGLNYSKNSDTNTAATELFVNREVYKNTYGYADIGNVDANGTKNTGYAIGVIYTF